MTTYDRIKSQRKHDQKQALVNLVTYTVLMLVCIVFCMINDTNIDRLFF